MSLSRVLGRHRPQGRTEETALHPTISYCLTQARAADLHRQAQRAVLARAARRAGSVLPGDTAAGSAAPAPGIRVRRRPSPRTVLAIASLGSAVAFVDATIVNIAFPDIARSFPGTPVSTLSWVLNGYNVVFAAFLMAAAGIGSCSAGGASSSSACSCSPPARCCARSRRRRTP